MMQKYLWVFLVFPTRTYARVEFFAVSVLMSVAKVPAKALSMGV